MRQKLIQYYILNKIKGNLLDKVILFDSKVKGIYYILSRK